MGSTLRIHCFGELQIELDGKVLSGFETDKARALLVYLALESSHPLQRSQIAGILWSDETEERALHNLRQALSYLRKALGENLKAPTFILADRDSIQLSANANVWVDAKDFTQFLACAYRHYQGKNRHGFVHVRCLQKAVALYQNQFLSQFFPTKCELFEEWALLERENYNLQAIKAFALLAEYYERRGNYVQAIQTYQRIVELSPWDETARAHIIRLLGVNQEWSAAKSQYFALKKYLAEQLSAFPSAEVTELYTQICAAASEKTTIEPVFALEKWQLPNVNSSFIGREQELDEVMDLLISPENRLITLLGPGGIGKTHFAVEIANQLVGVVPQGVFFVSLSSATSSTQILPLIAESLGLALTDQMDLQKQLIDHLRQKTMLLVLDNFEQLLADPESTKILDGILQQAPNVIFLITSREQLNLQQETIYSLDGLTYPLYTDLPIEAINQYESLKLFTKRATQKIRGFVLDESNLSTVIRICRALEGLPLGVELAAATICEQGYQCVAEKIENDLDGLSTNISNIEPRHRSLNAAFEASWGILAPQEQVTLSRLSVFPDGFDLQAGQEIAGASSVSLSALVSKSLILVNQVFRYSFHQAIRHFVSKKDIAVENSAEVRERHALYYAQFLEEINPELKGSGQMAALAAIQTDYSNVELAWCWLVETRQVTEMMRCVDSLYHYFSIRSLFQEGIHWFQLAKQNILDEGGNELFLGMLLSRLGSLAFLARENSLAMEELQRSQKILKQINALDELAFCWICLGWMSHREKDFAVSQSYAKESLDYFETVGNDLGASQALTLLGVLDYRQGNYQSAKTIFTNALRMCRQTENQRQLVTILNRLGDISCYEGQYEIAIGQFSECLEISQLLNDRYNQAILQNNLGTIYHVWKNYPRAKDYYQNSLEICRDIGDQDGIALALSNLGELAILEKDYTNAIRYSESALQIAYQLQENWTVIACLNSLGEIYCGMELCDKSKPYFLKALRLAMEINDLSTVARVSINLARVYQLLGDQQGAIELLQAALCHSSTEYDLRKNALQWLAEMKTDPLASENNELLPMAVKRIIQANQGKISAASVL